MLNTQNKIHKASGGDGIPAELFQILKDDAVKVLHSICQQIWKTQQWPQDWERLKAEGKEGNRGWLDGITDTMDMNLGKLREMVVNRDSWHAAVHGVTNSGN